LGYLYWPILQSFLFLGAAWATFAWLNSGVDDNDLAATAQPRRTLVVGQREWVIWTLTASLATATAVALLTLGCVQLLRVRERTRGPDFAMTRTDVIVHFVFSVLFLGTLAVFSVTALRGTRTVDWHVSGMQDRLTFVVGTGLAGAAPWVALTWLGHQTQRPYWRKHRQEGTTTSATTVTTATATASASPGDLIALRQLKATWEVIVAVALAFAGFVAAAIVPTGALRNLWLSQTPPVPVDGQPWELAMWDKQVEQLQPNLEATFPASDVLSYGAFFGLLSAVLVIPLVMAWRSSAKKLVADTYPCPAGDPAEEKCIASRGRLEADLNLSTTVLRNPLTVLTILTPLVTAALAAFLPQIGS